MNEWLRKIGSSITDFWTKASIVKKIILFGVIIAIVVIIIITARMSSRPSGVRLFNSQVRDDVARGRILDRISEANIQAYTTDDGYIIVPDEKIARNLRSTLISEGLVPSSIDPFASFYNRTWSTTDKEQNVKLKNAMVTALENHLSAIDDISSANVSIVLPEKEVFTDNQNPVSASVILNLKPNSDIATNRRRVQGIQRIILSAVEGLKEENLTISDMSGNVLNDFEGMAETDRINIIEKQQKLRKKLEAEKKAAILKSVQGIASSDRIRDLNINIEFDMSEKSVDSTEYSPITRKQDNPDTPYDDSEIIDSIPISEQVVTKEWQGTGYNPEGPAGVEGQTPPVYSDMSNVVGKSTEKGVTHNNAVNSKRTTEKVAPQVGKTTVSFNVDGVWTIEKDAKTHRYALDEETGGLKWIYTPPSEDYLSSLRSLAEGAIGFDRLRGDTVNVTGIQIDRQKEHEEFESSYFQSEQNKKTLILILVVVAVLLIAFILFRVISKEMERRRRIREEELLRQQQAEREKALWEARDNANNEVTMSVEDSRRAELQETAANLAKEHPEDVAMLIRTWLMEE